jgi:hypothetical protein
MKQVLKEAQNTVELYKCFSACSRFVLLAAGPLVTPVFKQVESGFHRAAHNNGNPIFGRKTIHAIDSQLHVAIGCPRECVTHLRPAGRCSVAEIPTVRKGWDAIRGGHRLSLRLNRRRMIRLTE